MQKTFAPVYGFENAECFSKTFDVYLKDDEKIQLGQYEGQVIHLPGHTPDHVGYVFGQAIFTGDSMFNVINISYLSLFVCHLLIIPPYTA